MSETGIGSGDRWRVPPTGGDEAIRKYVPDPREVQARAKRLRRRAWLVAGVGLLLLLSLVLPHIHLPGERNFGRSLLLTGFYFLHVQPTTFGPPVNQAELAFGFNVTYLGIGLHELGLLLSVPTFWVLYPDDINRWLYRLLVIGSWLLALSVPFVFTGGLLMSQAGVPVSLGLAWLPMLLAGVVLVVATQRARRRIDKSWYMAKPELM